MINDDDLRSMRNTTLTAWGLTLAVIVIAFVIVKNCSVSVIY